MINDAAYWIAIAHLPRWRTVRINDLITKFYHENQITIEDFFNLPETVWESEYGLNGKEINDMQKAKTELTGNAFIAEALSNNGIELIPIISPDYSETLKKNLTASGAPPLLYIKGDKKILKEKSVAIVGSREASEKSLQFTDNVARIASKNFKVVVSGFAKGVDKHALDSAVKYVGISIIVLPQGILTFDPGFKTYYRQIIDGNVLVLSTFYPKSPWKVELAMARNTIIYGLADEIFVAESSDKGGTWSGVIDGLRKGRSIYVRKPDDGEKNANSLLIQKGAAAVNLNGTEIEINTENINKLSDDEIKLKVHSIINGRSLTAKEIHEQLGIDWSSKKLSQYLKTLDFIEVVKVKNTNQYKIKDTAQTTLFN